jgi:hypothetical protein
VERDEPSVQGSSLNSEVDFTDFRAARHRLPDDRLIQFRTGLDELGAVMVGRDIIELDSKYTYRCHPRGELATSVVSASLTSAG